MSPVASVVTAIRLLRSQWATGTKLARARDAKLRRLIVHACATVPYYRQLFDEAGIAPADIRTSADLAAIPVTTKSDLQGRDTQLVTSSAIARELCVEERTSGSTGRPFVVRCDPNFLRVRNALFLRVLASAGYRPGHRLMLVTAGDERRTRLPGWRYQSLTESPDVLLDEFERHRPQILYGCMTPLRQMAVHAHDAGLVPHSPRAIISTAESLEPGTRRLLETVFRSEVFDCFGLTEMGMVAWECARHDGYHLAEDTCIVDLGDAGRLVMTNLELLAMPLIRFVTGDLASFDRSGPCACGRHLARLASIEGRVVDCVRLSNGDEISPYRFTLALERIDGLDRYQLVQHATQRFTLRYEAARMIDEAALRHALLSLVGAQADIELSRELRLDPPPGRKFRVIDCRAAFSDLPGR